MIASSMEEILTHVFSDAILGRTFSVILLQHNLAGSLFDEVSRMFPDCTCQMTFQNENFLMKIFWN